MSVIAVLISHVIVAVGANHELYKQEKRDFYA